MAMKNVQFLLMAAQMLQKKRVESEVGSGDLSSSEGFDGVMMRFRDAQQLKRGQTTVTPSSRPLPQGVARYNSMKASREQGRTSGVSI